MGIDLWLPGDYSTGLFCAFEMNDPPLKKQEN